MTKTKEAIKDNIINHDDKYKEKFLLSYIQDNEQSLKDFRDYCNDYCDIFNLTYIKDKDLNKLAFDIFLTCLNNSRFLSVI